MSETAEARFWSKVDTTGDCWVWTAAKTDRGYGIFRESTDRLVRAHRFAWWLEHGWLPPELDHEVCRNHSCVRPSHLRPATTKQNAEHKAGARRDSVSGVRGVRLDHGRWRGTVTHHGVAHSAGFHDTIEQAEVAVVALRKRLFTHDTAS